MLSQSPILNTLNWGDNDNSTQHNGMINPIDDNETYHHRIERHRIWLSGNKQSWVCLADAQKFFLAKGEKKDMWVGSTHKFGPNLASINLFVDSCHQF